MDILKVLSRGTKRTANQRNPGATAAAAKLPSAGVAANPQLFHDDVGPPRGRKRKRRGGEDVPAQEQAVAAEEELSDLDLDFFARKEDGQGETENKQEEGVGTGHQSTLKEGEEVQRPRKKKAKLASEEECRQVLRSHRLKLTVLQLSHAQQPPKAKERHEEKKGEEPAKAKAAAKDEKKQIYPQPLVAFRELEDVYDAPRRLAENIAAQGFKVPTEVQMGSLPLLLDAGKALKKSSNADGVDVRDGVDFMAVAPTGSGKTITFLIPAIRRVLQRRGGGSDLDRHVLDAVVIAPTRELASQIVNEGKKLALGTGVRIVAMKRGMRVDATDVVEAKRSDEGAHGESDDDKSRDTGSDEDSGSDNNHSGEENTPVSNRPVTKADILVATPKLLLNFLSGGTTRPSKALHTVRTLILDEADVLFDPLFRKQTIGIWKACTNPDLRATFWSATMASNIESLVLGQLAARARRLSLPQRPLIRLVVGLKDTAVPNITHKLIYTATEAGKLLALRQLLHPSSGGPSSGEGPPLRPPFLVFTQTIERATALHAELRYDIPASAGGASRIAVLHSSLPERERGRAVARFRAGEVWVLITTDVLARGVDFAGVNGVVSYDCPGSAAAYVHRAGRTGRAGREGGVAVTLYTRDDIPFVRSVANVIAASERQAGKGESGGDGVQKWLLDALPRVAKADRRRLRVRGVEARRGGGKATITTESGWERRKANNRLGAIAGSKKRKARSRLEGGDGTGRRDDDGSSSEWGGIDD